MEANLRTPRVHRILDGASGGLLLAMVVFAPWAFATSTSAAIWAMNCGGYLLGALLAGKWVVRRVMAYEPQRWANGPGHRWPVSGLAVGTVLVLGYVLVSGLNARAVMDYTFTPKMAAATGLDIQYRDPVEWLPQSYDGPRTIRAFWKYLAMALSFWAARDWLLGRSRRERRMSETRLVTFPTGRVARLLWTLVISSAALSIVGVLQRLDGTDEILWVFKSPNRSIMNFGPFPYRGHASEYLNLVWPVVLGFWWCLRDKFISAHGISARAGGGPHVVLLPLAVTIAIGPFLTASRGGVLVLAGLLPVALMVLLFARRTNSVVRIGTVVVLAGIVWAGWYLGGSTLVKRFDGVGNDKLGGREQIYESAARMESDFRLWGCGPETFARVFYLYRQDPGQPWSAYAHDDYLETRITFGLAGFAVIMAMLLLVPFCTQFGQGIVASREFLLLLLLGMGGILLHARFDFPFQSYCLHFEFLILCALLSCLTIPRKA
jgi:O-antigen ligase